MKELTKIKNGLELLMRHDGYLLENSVHERAITHKLGEHLQCLFSEWNVDCEFNKNLSQPKEIRPEDILSAMAESLERMRENNMSELIKIIGDDNIDDILKQLRELKNIEYHGESDDLSSDIPDIFNFKTKGKKKDLKKIIYPDIIIHHRGTSDNYIVIEAKTTKNKDKKSRLFDLLKILAMTSSSRFNYKKGIFIDIPVGKDLRDFYGFKVNPDHHLSDKITILSPNKELSIRREINVIKSLT